MPFMTRRLVLLCGLSVAACSDDGGGASTDPATSTPDTTGTATTPTTGGETPTTGTAASTSTSTDTGAETGSTGPGGADTGTTMGAAETGTTSAGQTSGSSGGPSTTTSGSDETSGSEGTSGEGSSSGGVVDKCVAAAPTMPPGDCAAVGVVLQPPYDDDYTCADLGPLPGVPTEWGGLIVDRDDPNVLLAGGAANTAVGKLYALGLARDADCHIQGYTADPTTVYGPAEYNDGGITYHPDPGPLFISRWPVNQLGQLEPGDLVTTRIIDLAPFGVVGSPGGVTFVPPGFAGEGQLKAVSWPGGQWYTLALAPDGNGTFDVLSATLDATIVGGPEAFVYVSDANPEFPQDGLLVAEWSAGNIAAYTADDEGTPVVPSRKDFITGLTGAESAYIDPLSGDFLFATFSGQERLIVIRGFVPQPQ